MDPCPAEFIDPVTSFDLAPRRNVMSWLLFDRKRGALSLYTGAAPSLPHMFVGPPVGYWKAHNQTGSKSQGAWPVGVYKWSHYNEHAEMGYAPGCYPTAYGCEGIHVFSVPGRLGMGVHAGRTKGEPGLTGGKTMGCIRVPTEAMSSINSLHNRDALTKIEVFDGF
jgi:hypothetical protein